MNTALQTPLSSQPIPPHSSAEAIQMLFNDPAQIGMKIKDLTIYARKKTILKIHELNLPKKGVVAIMGPSGSGKSTFLKSMSELMDDNIDHKGSIEVCCSKNSKEARSLCSQFAMVWQKPTVFPCSIWNNLKIPLRKREIDRKQWRKRMEDALEKTGLIGELDEKWWKQQAQRLSGGQQQRLSIAMGLLKDSNIFLFDEPTSALDPISTEKIEKIICELGTKKLVLLVTHSIGQARRVSNYSAMFHNTEDAGALCEFAPSDDFFKNPVSAKSREFFTQETGM